MRISLILYAEHEFNASTFAARVIAGTGADMYSAVTGAIGALRGRKHGGANEVALEIRQRYDSPDEAERDIRQRVANSRRPGNRTTRTNCRSSPSRAPVQELYWGAR
jgi:2-methylcitrate synthase